MRTLGIDPGSRITGYGVIEKSGSDIAHIDNGIIKPDPSSPFFLKLKYIYWEIDKLIRAFKPDVLALEDIFVAKNVKSAIKLGHVRGVTMLAATSSDINVAEYTPAQVKQAIVGVGNASKEQVQKMVKALLKLPEVATEDASDALAVAICHLHSFRLQGMMKG